MDEILEILEKKKEELQALVDWIPPEEGTEEHGRDEIRKKWLNWLEHLIFLMKR